MSRPAFMLALEPGRWRIAAAGDGEVELRDVVFDETEGPTSAADQLPDVLGELGWRGSAICLALPSSMVLSARVEVDGLPRRQRDRAMLYRLEEQLPVEAEAMTACFCPPVGGRSMGAAVRTDVIRPIVDALSEAGIETAAICPTALLACRHYLHDLDGDPRWVILTDPSQADVVCLSGGVPLTWSTVETDGVQVRRCLQVDSLNRLTDADAPRAMVAGPAAEAVAGAIEDEVSVTIGETGEDANLAAAALAAKRLLDGENAGWVDLCRDGLATGGPWGRLAGQLRLAAVLAAAFTVTLAGVLLWRGMQYEALTDGLEEIQRRHYVKLYPNSPVPVGVVSRLESELRRLSGVSGAGSDLPAAPNALETLRRVVAALPAEIRLRITQLRVDPSSILIEGQAHGHGDAEIIAKSLSQAGLPTDPPRTERLASKGVSFTLTGSPGHPRGPEDVRQ